ncbi:MAG TPA: phosphodiesterase [Spirochaetota bacterium]|jgi:diguanylate cyclase (GGDEF)-like protein|nr:MAG: Phytochrome-like protein cph2 [Spirochaetes bacterium ADurb.Bin133]HNZ27466.1 phosphodiesterase [Spirochaetota bacterium]HPY86388.1 phosphodiesterase [Spirochaetota bacterium]
MSKKATKFINRNMLKKGLEQILCNMEETEKIAILDVEIENIWMIDNTFGHAVGEQVIIKSAEILNDLFEDCLYISRTGEREFVIVLPQHGNNEQIKIQARKVIDSFSDPLLIDTEIEALFVTVSVGIALYPEDGKDADTLLENAHLAVHKAKTADNKIAFYTEQIKTRIAETTLLTNRLFRSLQKEEFFLEFQPQISCDTGKIAGVEVLLRLKPDDRRKVGPDKFVPILETTGLIHNVGKWVLEQSLRERNRLASKGFLPLRFSINVSVVQLQRDDFADDVVKIIKESGVDPKYIELEITEGALSENLPDTIEKISKLKKLGISVAIDDFGKGYSSLHRLESIPFDRIKIDKSIIDNINLERKNATVAEIVVSLAKAFKACTTAEGAETRNQVDFLKNLGCDEIQGYYFSKPLSAERLEEFLDSGLGQAQR